MPCDWPIDRSCLPALPTLSDPVLPGEQAALDAAQAERNAAEDVAVGVLWALSGRQFGLCPTLVRPNPGGPKSLCDEAPLIRAYYENDARGLSFPFGESCAPPRIGYIILAGPVDSITKVTVDGVVLLSSEYQLEGNRLYATSTDGWPLQNMNKPLGQPGTWSVEYVQGFAPPEGTAGMVGLLAKEFLLACDGNGKCRLPRTVSVANRQGITYRVYDPRAIYNAGKTGLPEIDMWLSAINPAALTENVSVI